MKTWLFLMGVLGALLAVPVGAEIIGVETFDYPDGNVASQNGGVFWDYKNTAPAGRSGTASTWDVLNPTPTFNAGQLVTSGNAVAKREYNGFSESDGAIRDANVAKTVYYRVNVTTGPSVTPGDYFGISSVDGGTEVFYFGKRGVSPNWAVEEVGVGGTNGSFAVLPNQTYTLVVQVDLPGNAIRLYVNPDLNSAQSAPFNASTAQVASQGYNGTAASTGVRFAAGTEVRWDNLVVATTWEELRLTIVTTLDDEDDGAASLNTPSDISLREAVKYSPAGSFITFAAGLNGQTCTLSAGSEIVVTKNLTLDASSLSGGLTIDGGAGTNRLFYVNSGQSLTLRGLTLTGGNGGGSQFGGDGGAIYNEGTLTLTQCTLSGNSASRSGGAIYNTGTLTLTQCTISGNSANSDGGGISDSGGSCSLHSCTLNGNSGDSGGGISIQGGVFTVHSCTLVGNSADLGGGILNYGELSLADTIVSGNSALNSPDIEQEPAGLGASITVTGVNLIGSLAGSTLAEGSTVLVGDPKLSPLGYFGGPVQTMHPLIGSPAIDAAGTDNPGGTDARGFPRFVDGDASGFEQLDIGAVEAGPLSIVSNAADTLASTTLRTRINNAAGIPGARVGFLAAAFPATITLGGTELGIPATANGLFIDASNLSGPVTVSGNNASRVFNITSGATVAMHSVRIVNGKAADGGLGSAGENGGGILNAGSLSLFSCTLSGHATGSGGDSDEDLGSSGGSGGNGGGIFSSGSLSLTACTLSGNATGNGGISSIGGALGGYGGGIFSSGSLSLTACTLSGNRAGNGGIGSDGGSGGGIFSAGSLSLTACTLSGNAAGTNGDFGSGDGFGGGLSGGSVLLENCLIGLNTGGDGTPDDVNVTSITYVGGNQLGTAATVTGAATGAPTFVETPSIRDLGVYGGPTQTIALQPNSRARNAGTATARRTDQRGFPIVGEPDLGAFEGQIGAIADVSLLEGATPPARTFPVGQIGTLTAASDNTTLVPEENIVITGSGASRDVTVTPAAGQRGICIITLTEDLHGEQQTFEFEVTEDTRFIVTSSADAGGGSLRNALSLAASTAGTNTIRFAPEVTAIALASEIFVNDTEPVLVDASALVSGLGLTAGPNSRHFQVAAGASLTLRGITLQGGNAGGDGGSIYSEGTLILERCTLANNQSALIGGAVGSRGTELRAVDCGFLNNTAQSGGGVFHATGMMQFIGCTFASNTANMAGALLLDNPTPATLTQCTLANNQSTAPTKVGGIRAFAGTLNLVQCTVSGNVGDRGGLELAGAAAVNLTNNIIAGNRTSGGAPVDLFLEIGTLVPQGVNLIGSNQSVEAVFPAGPLVGTAAAPRDPMLESFNSYGGRTNTMPPRVGSPALDQATVLDPALTTDQRGFARPLGIRPDLGAVEASIIVVTTPVDELDAVGVIGNGISLREAIRDVPENGTIGFDRAVFNSLATNVITLTQGPLNPQRPCTLDGSNNPGGIDVQYAPEFTQPQSVSAATGEAVSFDAAVTAISGGVAYKWYQNDVFTGATTATFSIPSAQETNEGVYQLRIREESSAVNVTTNSVSLASFVIDTQPASLVVDGAPAITFQRQPGSAMLSLGQRYELSVIAIGPPPLKYQWLRAGRAIPGATKSDYVIPKAALSHAGAYTCVVKSGLASVPSTSVEIGVVDTRVRVLNLKAGSKFTSTAIAAGNGLSYQWFRNVGQRLNGETSKTLTPINSVSVADSNFYDCEVTGPAGTNYGGGVQLTVTNAAPALVTPLDLPPAYIGQNYFYRVIPQNAGGALATSFSVSGALPSGIRFDKTTGVLSGRPTVTKSAGYPLSFRASNPSGSSAAVAATLQVIEVPATVVGSFAGPLGRSVLNGNLGGRFDLTVSKTGTFSGSVMFGALKRSFRSQLVLSAGAGDAILRGNIGGMTLADRTPVTAYVEFFAVEQVARLTLVGAEGTTLGGEGWRKNGISEVRVCHFRLDPGTVSGAPQGYGFGSFRVSASNSLRFGGRLPDGSGLTGSGFVGPRGQVVVFQLLYGNRGSLVGQYQLTGDALSGALSWFKPVTTTGLVYREGFGPLGVAVGGGVYVPPAAGQLVMAANAVLDFGRGGLSAGFSQPVTVANPSVRGLTNTAKPNTPLVNSTKITKFDVKTGTVTGSFVEGTKVAPWSAQLVTLGGVTSAYGYFLLPTGVPNNTTSPRLSGVVVLGGP